MTQPTPVIYQGHLQIVSDLAVHNKLKEIHLEEFPTAILIAPDVMKLLHDDTDYRDYIQRIHNNHTNGVYYMLPAGTYGASKGYHCNGIRFGSHPSDYISLVNFKQFGE